MQHYMEPIVRALLGGLSVYIVAKILPGISVKSFTSSVIFAFIAGIFNAIAWHYLAIITVPFTVITLGVGYFIINGLLFLLAARVIKGVEISGCFTAAIAALGVSLLNGVMQTLFGRWAP